MQSLDGKKFGKTRVWCKSDLSPGARPCTMGEFQAVPAVDLSFAVYVCSV